MQPENNNIEAYINLPIMKTVEDKYQIKDKLLGQGTFAKTYISINIKTKQILACKMISKQELLNLINAYQSKNSAKNYFIKALKNEMTTCKKLKHKNIVLCEDVLETKGNIYFFLQYCNQGTLFEKMKEGRLSYEEAIQAFRQIIDGCAYLYSENIFHRDLKPQNILIKDGTYKISDFGFAKHTEEALKDFPMKGTIAGTPIYMAPQILKGDPYSLKCDVWSLGVIFYKLLFGFLPWESVQDKQKLLQSIQQPIKFPPSQPVPPQIQQLICDMLRVDEADRISIVKVKQILDQLFDNKSMEVQQP